MKIPIYQVDAFTDVPFKGNPAAVCPLEEWFPDEVMQSIATENNLSETAFFIKNGHEAELRWFAPKGEIDLCGHATLAAAYVIFTYMDDKINQITFHTKSGALEVSTDGKLLTMVFPSRPAEKCEIPEALIKGLGKVPKEVLKARDYMAVFEMEEELLDLQVNREELLKLDRFGVLVTAKGNNVDFVSRFFVPKAGIDEDPVTGSTHCTLVPYWKNTLNKSEFTAYQLSDRGGTLHCVDLGDRVQISGEAVSYLEGFIHV